MKGGTEDGGASLIFANLKAKALAAKRAAPEVRGSPGGGSCGCRC